MDRSVPSSISQIIPHLFLLRELPSQSSPSEFSAYCFISLVNRVLESLISSGLARVHSVQRSFATWSDLQTEDAVGALDAAKLQAAVVALGPGDHLPLYVRAQNACLIFSRLPSDLSPSTSSTSASATASIPQTSNSCSDQPQMRSADDMVFSTFAPALTSKQVVDAGGELLCSYPQTSIRVERSSLLLSKTFAEQVARLHECPIDEAAATKQRRSTILLEVQRAVLR